VDFEPILCQPKAAQSGSRAAIAAQEYYQAKCRMQGRAKDMTELQYILAELLTLRHAKRRYCCYAVTTQGSKAVDGVRSDAGPPGRRVILSPAQRNQAIFE
jgi:hypothetical protein